MTESPLPQPMNLPGLQAYIASMVEARGFTRDINRIFILLTEELGEIATQFKYWIYYPDQFELRSLGYELVDLLMYLLDLANKFEQDLATLWPQHEKGNDQRFAERRPDNTPLTEVNPHLGLNQMVAHVEIKRKERNFEDTPERLMILLTEEIGEIGTEIRKHWKGKCRPENVGHETIDALTYLFRLAHVFDVDLERALIEKEAINAQRVWEY